MLINMAGMILFLPIASSFWIEPELTDVPGASGGAAVGWAVFAAPVFLGFVLANILWLGLALWTDCPHRRAGPIIAVMLTLASWMAVYLFDNMHHGI
jgi:apolipoprotein N-acyltransferase